MLKPQMRVMAFTLGTVFALGNGCVTSVNALYRQTADSDRSPIITPIESCPVLAGGPAGAKPLPTAPQVAHGRAELTAYIHFGLNTFDGTEYGNSTLDTAALFDPTNLDVNQWVRALKDAGFREAMLVAKHNSGFCLWPSAYTDYSVKSSPWKNGQGDLVKDFADAMRAAGMRIGIYLAPADQHFPSSSPDYEAYFKHQLTELLTNYGPLHEIYLTGSQSLTSLDWKGIAALAKELQPNILVWMGPEIATTGADVRYIGDQSGRASRSTSSIADVPNGGPANVWYPADAPLSDRGSSWFWHPDGTVISLDSLKTAYFNTVGMNSTLILNVPPTNVGQFDTPDINLLQQFGSWYAALYEVNLLRNQPATADSTWASSGFEAPKALDDDVCTYWAAAGGRTTARLEVNPASPILFQRISIREAIELGERSTGYHIELKQNGVWNTAPKDVFGAQIQGTIIGERQLWQLSSTNAEAIALVIDSARDVPVIAEFSVY